MVHRRLLVGTVQTAVLLAASVAVAQPAQPAQPAVVEAVPVVAGQVAAQVSLVATVRAMRTSRLGSTTAGRVETVAAREGTRVKAGDLVVQLEQTQPQMLVDEAKARLAALEQRLALIQAGTREEQVAMARAKLAETNALVGKWEAEYKRIQDLAARNSASTKELSDCTAELNAAMARRDEAAAALDEAQRGARPQEIATAQAEVAAAQAFLARLQDQFVKTKVRAPFDGVITTLHTEQGQWLSEGGNVADLVEIQPVLIRVGVPERYVPAISPGMAAQVDIEPLGRQVNATVLRVIPQADMAARTFPVELEVPNPDGAILPGMFCRAYLPAGPVTPALLVPKDAVSLRGNAASVMLVVDDKAVPVAVEVIGAEGAKFGVRGDLAAGAMVVTRGNEALRAGQPLIVRAAPASQPVAKQGT